MFVGVMIGIIVGLFVSLIIIYVIYKTIKSIAVLGQLILNQMQSINSEYVQMRCYI